MDSFTAGPGEMEYDFDYPRSRRVSRSLGLTAVERVQLARRRVNALPDIRTLEWTDDAMQCRCYVCGACIKAGEIRLYVHRTVGGVCFVCAICGQELYL